MDDDVAQVVGWTVPAVLALLAGVVVLAWVVVLLGAGAGNALGGRGGPVDAALAQALAGAMDAMVGDRDMEDGADAFLACTDARTPASATAAHRVGLYYQALVGLDLAVRSGADDTAVVATMVAERLGRAESTAVPGLAGRLCAKRWPDCADVARRVERVGSRGFRSAGRTIISPH